jgi:hypothetical protein
MRLASDAKSPWYHHRSDATRQFSIGRGFAQTVAALGHQPVQWAARFAAMTASAASGKSNRMSTGGAAGVGLAQLHPPYQNPDEQPARARSRQGREERSHPFSEACVLPRVVD